MEPPRALLAAQKPLCYWPQFLSSKVVISFEVSSNARYFGSWVPRATVEVVDDHIVVEEEDKAKEKSGILRVGVICGGPSAERGISLNSARSVLDHIQV